MILFGSLLVVCCMFSKKYWFGSVDLYKRRWHKFSTLFSTAEHLRRKKMGGEQILKEYPVVECNYFATGFVKTPVHVWEAMSIHHKPVQGLRFWSILPGAQMCIEVTFLRVFNQSFGAQGEEDEILIQSLFYWVWAVCMCLFHWK